MSPTIRRTLLGLLAAAVALYAVAHLTGPNGLPALLEKRAALSALEEENLKLEEAVANKAKYVEDVKAKKPEVIIPLIRDRTNWVRDGEQDFRIEKESPRAQPAE